MRLTTFYTKILICLSLLSLRTVAQNGCADSTYRFALFKSNHNIIPTLQESCADLSLLIAGNDIDKASSDTVAFLSKFNASGEILWQVGMREPGLERILPQQLKEAANGDILLVALQRAATTVHNEIVLLKFNSAGSLVWQKKFQQNLVPFEENISILDLVIDESGDIFLSATVSRYDLPNYSLLCRLNDGGNIVWSKVFSTEDTVHDLFGISIDNDRLTVFGRFIGGPNTCNPTDMQRFSGMKISIANGELIDQKTFCLPIPHAGVGYNPSMYAFTLTKTANKNYVISGKQFGQGTSIKKDFVSLEFDENFSFVSGRIITTSMPAIGNIKTSADGYTVVTMPMSAANTLYYGVIDPSGKFITRKKILLDPGMEILTPIANARALHFRPDRSFVFSNLTKVGPDLGAQVFSLPFSSPQDDCSGRDDAFATTLPVSIIQSSWNWTLTIDNVLTSSSSLVNITALSIDKRDICKERRTCTSVKIEISDTVCMNFQDKVFVAKRSVGCEKQVNWDIDPKYLEAITRLSDTSVRVRFKNPPSGGSAEIPVNVFLADCPNVRDTKLITLMHSGKPMPSEILICKGDTVELTYGNWFADYTWQDGSKQAVLSVHEPGRYLCMVKDYCNETRLGVLTVVAQQQYNTGLNDTIACSEQPVLLRPAGGLQTYSWTADPFLLRLNDSTVSSIARHNSLYYFEGRSSEGCIFKDTVQVIRWPSPTFSLGTDTAICRGENLTLLAPTGFNSYSWNTGSFSNSISVDIPGKYSVFVSDANGCSASDTVLVKDRGCLSTIIFPSAFTPDNNGRNDNFKPIVFGIVQEYQLQIFNRWGQKVFHSATAERGWDGSMAGKKLQAGTYVYVCSYRLEGAEKVVKKGAVLLIR